MNSKEDEIVNIVLGALKEHKAIIHPTDTIPGLSFDPDDDRGRQAVVQFKGREETKPFLGLVSSLEQAKKFWQPLPAGWSQKLEKLWPGPLSVVWQASEDAPRRLVGTDGTMGLRVPALHPENQWYLKVLGELGKPMPTTSVNHAGQQPALNWAEVSKKVLESDVDVFVTPGEFPSGDKPSTIIRLLEGGGFEVLREGAIPRRDLEQYE